MVETSLYALAAEAANPSTSQARLAELAHTYPQLRSAIAANPSSYEALREWIAQFPEPEPVSAETAAVAVPAVDVPAGADQSKPTRAIPLRWGTYRLRYWISFAGFTLAAATSLVISLLFFFSLTGCFDSCISYGQLYDMSAALSLVLPLVGLSTAIVAHPSAIQVRGLAAIPAVVSLVGGLIGPYWSGGSGLYRLGSFVAVLLLAMVWLILRRRPGKSYFALFFAPLSIPVTLFISNPADGVLSAALLVFLIFGIIFLGRVFGKTQAPAAVPLTAEQLQAREHEQRVVHLQQWEAAYRSAHNGEAPPAGFVPPMAPVAASGSTTNTMAILALVFGIGGGLLGIIFGHMARAQIRRTREQGWGLATAGLVLGYVGLSAGILTVIGYIVLIVVIR